MLHKGDKITMKSPIGTFNHVGECLIVTDVRPNGEFTYATEDGKMLGRASKDMFNKYFDMYEKPKVKMRDGNDFIHERVDKSNSVATCDVDDIIDASDIVCTTLFDKCTLVACKLPNGFVLTSQASCVDPADYDEELGFDMCMDDIRKQVTEFESYRLQNEVGDLKPDAKAMTPLFDDNIDDNIDDTDDDYDDCDGFCVDCVYDCVYNTGCNNYYDMLSEKDSKNYDDFLAVFDTAFDEYVKISDKWKQ